MLDAKAPVGGRVGAEIPLPAAATIRRVSGAVVACGTLWTVWLLIHSYYYVDDFLRLRDASRASLNWSYLSQSVFGHFVPGWRLAFFLLERLVPLNYAPVIVGCAVLQGLTLIGLYRLLTAVCGERWLVPLVLFWYAISPALLVTEYWFANALHVMPSIALAIFGVDGFVRFVKTGRRRTLLYSVPCACSGLMFYEKPVLTLMFMPALLVVVAISRFGLVGGVRRAGLAITRMWWLWPLYVVPMGIYFAYYFTHQYYARGPQTPPGVVRHSGVPRLGRRYRCRAHRRPTSMEVRPARSRSSQCVPVGGGRGGSPVSCACRRIDLSP